MIVTPKIKKVAISSARQAGSELRKIFKTPGQIKFSLKAKHQVVTKADLLAEKIILKKIRKNFPDHDILSEESGSFNFASKDYLWIVDPLDGTTNFTIKNPIFSTAIALAFKGRIILGVIYAPVLDEFYWSVKGEGAWFNSKRLRVSKNKDIKKGFHTYCYGTSRDVYISKAISYYKKMFTAGHEIRQLGAATVEFARVAQGITDSIVIPGAHAWDVAAGALLVREAGGKVTDFKNKQWNIKSKDIIATNGKVHEKLLKYLR